MRRLSSAAMQPSIACASPGARVQEQSTCALLLLHRGTVCMSPGAPARMRAAAGLRTYARAAARAQPVHIHGFSCTLPLLHRDDAESGSNDQRGLLLTWCACTHAVSCVFVLAAWASCVHAQEPVCAGLSPREACGQLARPNDAAKQGSHVAGCAAAYTHAGAAARCVSSNAAEHGSHVARSAPGSHIRERLCASTTAPYARTQEQPCAASPARQCCQHDSQATRRAAARCPHGDMRAHAGAAVRGVSPTTKPIRPTAVRPSSGAHTHMRAIATVCRLHSTVSTSQGQPHAACPPADDVCRLKCRGLRIYG